MKVIKGSESFLREYLELVANISLQQNDLLWWATDFSSKNRFQTSLPCGLQAFLEDGRRVKVQGISWVVLLLRVLRHFVRSYCRAVRSRQVLGDLPRTRCKFGGQYVIKSFVYDSSFTSEGVYRDPFFGELPSFLGKMRPVLVVVDVQGDYEKALERMKVCVGANIFPWEYYLSLTDILYYSWRMLWWHPCLKTPVDFMSCNVSQLVRDFLSSSGRKIQPPQLFHYSAFLRLSREIKVDRLLLTYESNPWEKMCILAVRKGAPLAKIYGYQHNVIPQASANMFLAPAEVEVTPVPDKILTTGEEPRGILEKYSAYAKDKIQISCALRMAHLFREPFSRGRGRRVLVALEGVDEVKHLIRYVFDNLKNTGIEVVFRTHPVLPWSYFEKHYGFWIKDIIGFSVSSGKTLIDDIRDSDIVLYWGTTVAMEALSLGRPVVHFDNGSCLSFDPLFCCQHLKWSVQRGEALRPVLERIFLLSDDEFAKELFVAREYLKEYFYPVSDEAMKKFI